MARGVAVSVHYGDRVFYADVDPGERADQLLVRSLYHFGIDPGDKHRYRLIRRGAHRPAHGLYLDRPIGDQVESGAELAVEEDQPENRRLATGTY